MRLLYAVNLTHFTIKRYNISSMLRFLFYVVFLGAAVLFIYTFQPPTVCDNPIPYRIGSIDSRYDTIEQQFLTNVAQAAEIWSLEYGKQLFSYNPSDKK